MIRSATYLVRETDPSTGEVRTKVTYYSECDFKTNVPNMLAKPFAASSLRGFIDKCVERMKVLYAH